MKFEITVCSHVTTCFFILAVVRGSMWPDVHGKSSSLFTAQSQMLRPESHGFFAMKANTFVRIDAQFLI